MIVVPEDFYGPLQDRLSQGDLVKAVPWGLIDVPVLVCRPSDATQLSGKANYAPVKAEGYQGLKSIHAAASIGPAMVLWHDCQIDKFANQGKPEEKWFAAVAPILPLARVGDMTEAVRSGQRRAFFFLPAYPAIGLDQDSYVDLRHIWSIKQGALSGRFGTLSPVAREGLYAHLFTFLTSRRLKDAVKCPACQSLIPMAELAEKTDAD